ncbi:MAG: tetratricopeptide repeat protein [Xenococcaceae cyanobacterium]
MNRIQVLRPIAILLVAVGAISLATNSKWRSNQIVEQNSDRKINNHNNKNSGNYFQQVFAYFYYKQGVFEYKQKKWPKAEANFTKVIQLNFYLPEAYFCRASTYIAQRQWKLALSDLNLAIELNPDYAEAYGNRAFIRNEMKDKQNAISDLQKAAQLFRSRNNLIEYQKTLDLLKKIQQ